MKTKTLILIFAALAAVCAGLTCLFFLQGTPSSTAEVYSDGVLVCTIDLSKDGTYRVDHGDDWNLLTVRDGTLAVTAASCAGGDCIRHGAANRGAPIVCLPNRLVIQFTQDDGLDAVTG